MGGFSCLNGRLHAPLHVSGGIENWPFMGQLSPGFMLLSTNVSLGNADIQPVQCH